MFLYFENISREEFANRMKLDMTKKSAIFLSWHGG